MKESARRCGEGRPPCDTMLAPRRPGTVQFEELVTEELLVEAHEVPETSSTTAMFFLGFLVLFVIEIIATPGTT